MSYDLQRNTPLSMFSVGTMAGLEGRVVQMPNQRSALAETSSRRKFSSVFNFQLAVPPLALLTIWVYLKVGPNSSGIIETLGNILVFSKKWYLLLSRNLLSHLSYICRTRKVIK
jgi:hypothetical protein